MAQGKPRDQKRERLWRRHLREQQLSGLTARDFCSLHQLAESTFHFWRREIARRDDEQQQATSAHREPSYRSAWQRHHVTLSQPSTSGSATASDCACVTAAIGNC